MDNRPRIKTKDFEPGVIYFGTLVGEVQKDMLNGKIYWKRPDGKIQEINPDPNSLWLKKEIK